MSLMITLNGGYPETEANFYQTTWCVFQEIFHFCYFIRYFFRRRWKTENTKIKSKRLTGFDFPVNLTTVWSCRKKQNQLTGFYSYNRNGWFFMWDMNWSLVLSRKKCPPQIFSYALRMRLHHSPGTIWTTVRNLQVNSIFVAFSTENFTF